MLTRETDMQKCSMKNTSKSKAETIDYSVYVDLETARKAIVEAAVQLVRGDEYQARMILVNWLAEDRGETIPPGVREDSDVCRGCGANLSRSGHVPSCENLPES